MMLSSGMSLLAPLYSTNVFVSRCQDFSRSVAPALLEMQSGRRVTVARVCLPVRLSADLSSHLPLDRANKGREGERKNRLIQPRVEEAMKEMQLLAFGRKKVYRASS